MSAFGEVTQVVFIEINISDIFGKATPDKQNQVLLLLIWTANLMVRDWNISSKPRLIS